MAKVPQKADITQKAMSKSEQMKTLHTMLECAKKLISAQIPVVASGLDPNNCFNTVGDGYMVEKVTSLWEEAANGGFIGKSRKSIISLSGDEPLTEESVKKIRNQGRLRSILSTLTAIFQSPGESGYFR